MKENRGPYGPRCVTFAGVSAQTSNRTPRRSRIFLRRRDLGARPLRASILAWARPAWGRLEWAWVEMERGVGFGEAESAGKSV